MPCSRPSTYRCPSFFVSASALLGLLVCACGAADGSPMRGSEAAGVGAGAGLGAAGQPTAGAPVAGQEAGTSAMPQLVAGQAAGAAGEGSSPLDECAAVGAQAEAQLRPTDVIWAIDTSGSMTASFPSIQQALNDFSQKVVDAGIDAHIVLLAGASAGLGGGAGLCVPPPLGSGQCGAAPALGGVAPDSNEPAFLHLDLPFGATQGMAVMLDNHAGFKHLLRPDALTQLVMTEDGAPLLAPQQVVDHIEGRTAATFTQPWMPPLLPGQWVFNGVVCETGTGTNTCLLPIGGAPLTTLELIQTTGGLVRNLDDAGNPATADPFVDLLDKLAEAVIVGAKIGCEYDIPPSPDGKSIDPDKVNVVYTDAAQVETLLPRIPDDIPCDDNQGWKYDEAEPPTQVVLCPAACSVVQADVGARVDVQFGCDTEVLRPD